MTANGESSTGTRDKTNCSACEGFVGNVSPRELTKPTFCLGPVDLIRVGTFFCTFANCLTNASKERRLETTRPLHPTKASGKLTFNTNNAGQCTNSRRDSRSIFKQAATERAARWTFLHNVAIRRIGRYLAQLVVCSGVK